MTQSVTVRILVLGVMPVVLAGLTAAFGAILGSSPLSALMQGVTVFTLLSIATWADLHREGSGSVEGQTELIVRELCAFALPFVCALVWAVVHMALGVVPIPASFVFPFIAGLMLGRAAIEYHYFRRSDESPNGHESVFYHYDDGD